MIPASQRLAAAIGESGCYFLSLCQLAEELTGASIDALRAARVVIDAGAMGEDCYLKDAAQAFTLIAGGRWRVLFAGDGKRSEGTPYDLPLGYVCAPTEREILRYEYTDAMGKTWAHFVVGTGSGRCRWDPEGTSNSVSKGRVVSKRIFRRI